MTLSAGWQALLLFAFVLVLTISVGARLIPLLKRWSFGQHAYEDAPETHAVKTGTPTMGGVLFLLALAIAAIVARGNPLALLLVFLGFGCGLVGFIDDYLSIRRGRNRGLRARMKLLLTGCVAAGFLWLVLREHAGPWTHAELHLLSLGLGTIGLPDWAWFVVSLIAILATTQAVNLTDGLDGLAAGTILPVLALLMWIVFRLGIHWVEGQAVLVIVPAIAGAVVGFLYYNRYPARLIMGDTGSLALGGVLAGSAILLGMQLLLILIGGVFVAETLSVILQVASFKLTGKRIFRMSPLHHHFELGGWPETKVTHRFWVASALCSLVGLALFEIGVSR